MALHPTLKHGTIFLNLKPFQIRKIHLISEILSPELGHYLLALSCCLAGIQFIVPLVGCKAKQASLMMLASPLAYAQGIALSLSFACLITASVTNDFSVLSVYQNSASNKPLLYKISGIWGNHEGSIFLWCYLLALFNSLLALSAQPIPLKLKSRALAIMGGCSAGFTLFCLLTSNPFLRLWPAPLQGQGMNPLLQDPGLALHPPLLYMGYVGFAIPFAFTVAGLLDNTIDLAWAQFVKPWVTIAWACLTCGIALGSWWSYYILGWGGYWFWDPVENASLLPWLTGTALIHALYAYTRTESLKLWTLLLSISTFSLSLSGTFLVRSGLLNSVHAFTSDPTRGVFILALLACISGSALLLYAWRAPTLAQETGVNPLSKEGSLIFNNILLCTIASIVLTGTLYPPFLQLLTNQSISVGKPFFEQTTVPFVLISLFFMAVGPRLPFKKTNSQHLLNILSIPAMLCLLIFLTSWFCLHQFLPALTLGLCMWVIIHTILNYAKKISFLQKSFQESWRQFFRLPYSVHASLIAHTGMVVTVLGITGMAFATHTIVEIPLGDTVPLAGYEWTLSSVQTVKGPNFVALKAAIKIAHKGKVVTWLFPSRKYFPEQNQIVTHVSIETNFIRDLYAALGSSKETLDKQHPLYILRLHYNPLAPWIWIGGLIMAFGGIITLWPSTKTKFKNDCL
ncbi:Cytochrome c-type biogenesis protein CcmF [Commensalibacter sp. Nvir]|nr:Cytochrome c-type biogenesis protein CcmF [Commensalibacter sp. Nvir]